MPKAMNIETASHSLPMLLQRERHWSDSNSKESRWPLPVDRSRRTETADWELDLATSCSDGRWRSSTTSNYRHCLKTNCQISIRIRPKCFSLLPKWDLSFISLACPLMFEDKLGEFRFWAAEYTMLAVPPLRFILLRISSGERMKR